MKISRLGKTKVSPTETEPRSQTRHYQSFYLAEQIFKVNPSFLRATGSLFITGIRQHTFGYTKETPEPDIPSHHPANLHHLLSAYLVLAFAFICMLYRAK